MWSLANQKWCYSTVVKIQAPLNKRKEAHKSFSICFISFFMQKMSSVTWNGNNVWNPQTMFCFLLTVNQLVKKYSILDSR